MKDSVIILSGGMDSVTLLYDKQSNIKLAISFFYGANHNMREIECAKYHCIKLGIEHVIIDTLFFKQYFTGNILKGANNIYNGDDIEKKKDSVVPFRNGIMLSIACGIAESKGLDSVLIANHKAKKTVLPDCSSGFISAFSDAMRYGTYKHIRLIAPYTNMLKQDIMKKGKLLGVDYSQTYSCYKGSEMHCGKCSACIERKEALKNAAIEDTTIYE